jgi:cell division protein ZapA (FtsZ GTPase activity inhibitor)
LDQLVTIEIFGNPFTFKADSSGSRAKKVAEHLAHEVARIEAQIAPKKPNIDKKAILILTALNITSEYFEYREKQADLIQTILGRSEQVIDKLESCV